MGFISYYVDNNIDKSYVSPLIFSFIPSLLIITDHFIVDSFNYNSFTPPYKDDSFQSIFNILAKY